MFENVPLNQIDELGCLSKKEWMLIAYSQWESLQDRGHSPTLNVTRNS